MSLTGADLGFIKGELTQGTYLLGRGVQSTLPSKSILELEGPGGMSMTGADPEFRKRGGTFLKNS